MRYEIHRELGTGGQAAVWEATDTWSGRTVAVKKAARRETLRGLAGEFRALARIRNSRVVEVYDYWANETDEFYSMEMLQGQPIREAFAERLVGSADLTELLGEALLGLMAVHRAGLIHNDLKPDHLWVSRVNGRLTVKLTDLGLAVSRRESSRPMLLEGTVHYLPPEKILGDPPTPLSDLYSLGVLFFELATGRRLSERLPVSKFSDLPSLLQALVSLEISSLLPEDASISKPFRGLILSLMAREPSFRPSSADEAFFRLAPEIPDGELRYLEALKSIKTTVGRAAETAQTLEALAGPNTGAVVIAGPRGTGKTHLLRVVESEMGVDRSIVELDRLALFRRRMADLLGETDTRANLSSTDQVEIAFRLVERFSEGRKPRLLLIADDVESIEPTAAQFLQVLVNRTEFWRGSILMTGRSNPLETERALVVTLGNLLPAEASQLAQSFLPPNEKAVRAGQAIAARTGGNPAFIVAAAESLVSRVKGFSDLAELLDKVETLSIPSDLMTFYMHALQTEGEADRRLMQVAAAVGRPFTLDLLAVAGEAVTAVFDRYADLGLLRATGGEYRFNYPDIQQWLSGFLPPVELTRLHQRLGEHLESSGRDSYAASSALAWHFSQGDDPGKALKYTLQAAANARSQGDWRAAAGHLEEALQRIRAGGDAARLAETLELQADTFEADGEYDRAIELTRAALELNSIPETRSRLNLRLGRVLVKLGDPVSALKIFRDEAPENPALAGEWLRWESTCYVRTEQIDLAQQSIEKALLRAVTDGDSEATAELLHNIGNVERMRKNPTRALQHFTRMLDLKPSPGLRMKAVNMIGLVHLELGHFEQARGFFQQALEACEEEGNRTNRAFVLGNIAIALQRVGDVDQAIDLTAQAAREFRLIGNLPETARLGVNLGILLVDTGRWTEAETVYREALDAAERSTYPPGHVRNSLARLRFLMGDFEGARNLLEPHTDDRNAVVRGLTLLNLASIDLKKKNSEAACQHIEAAIAAFESAERKSEALRARVLAVEIEVLRARLSDAERRLREVEAALETVADDHVRAAAYRAGAAIAFGRGDARLARDLMGRAIQGFKRRRNTYEEGICYSQLAFQYRVQGKVERSKMFGSRAREIFARLGALADLGELDRIEFQTTTATPSLQAYYPPPAAALSPLHHVAQLIAHLDDPEELIRETLVTAVELVGAERGVLVLQDEKDGEARVVKSYNADQSTMEDVVKLSATVLRHVHESGSMIYTANALSDSRFAQLQSIQSNSILSLICVPLRARSKTLGSLYLDSRSLTDLFSPSDRQTLEIFAGLAALAIENAQLLESVRLTNEKLQEEASVLREQMRQRYEFHGIVGASSSLARVIELIERAALSNANVLILGESGVGKELVARAIHYQSPRRRGPFIPLNCAAVPEDLLEAELFGIEKGVATGVDRRIGKFEQADGGTLFLDEIGDMPHYTQVKILRVIEDKKVQRLGSSKLIPIDVHIISATNRDLGKSVAEEKFREDLFHRLNVLAIVVPPLRERTEDIPILVEHLLRKIAVQSHRPRVQVSRAAMKALLGFSWPGNVRQLENTLTKALLMTDKTLLEASDLPDLVVDSPAGLLVTAAEEGRPLETVAGDYVRMVLKRCNYNKKEACRILNITYNTLQKYVH